MHIIYKYEKKCVFFGARISVQLAGCINRSVQVETCRNNICIYIYIIIFIFRIETMAPYKLYKQYKHQPV